jgi:hypothetical protein
LISENVDIALLLDVLPLEQIVLLVDKNDMMLNRQAP